MVLALGFRVEDSGVRDSQVRDSGFGLSGFGLEGFGLDGCVSKRSLCIVSMVEKSVGRLERLELEGRAV